MLKLMFITNNPEVAVIAQDAGVDRIFIDLEYIGKEERQKGMDSVKSHHTIDDIYKLRPLLMKSELIVRCNPIHDSTNDYCSSESEIKQILWGRPDIIMLPYFKTILEVKRFLECVNGECKTMLLLETPEAVDILDEILELDGIDFIHIGLNDLSLGYKKKFMFDLLFDGTVEKIINKIKKTDIPYGFGGIASLGQGTVPSENIIREHYRLGSTCAILSRSFCDLRQYNDMKKLRQDFNTRLKEIRTFESKLGDKNIKYLFLKKKNYIEIDL